MTEESDATLVERVLTGDTRAFESLVDRHQGRMFAYVTHMGFTHAEACDVVQDALIRAYRHLRKCGDPARFEGWLFKIVSNLCRTAGARGRRRRTERLEPLAPALEAHDPRPDEVALARATQRQVRSALDALPHDQREVLVLMYLHGLTVSEIEEVTGASKSAVKMRLMRGREALKDELAPLFPELAGR